MSEVTTPITTAEEMLNEFSKQGFNRFWREFDIDLFDEGYTGEFNFNDVEYGWNIVHQSGGGEGGGEYCESVIQFSVNGQALPGYVKVTYSYYSYDGFQTDYAEASAVNAREVLVTVYD